jgi:ABC-type glycerol-3-phosphate transport system substrate-binding protein
MVFAVTACTKSETPGQKDNGGSVSDNTGKDSTDKTPGKDIKLIHWTIFNPESTADPRSVALKSVLDNWNANNKWGATMTVEAVNWANLHAMFSQAAAAGNAPDVILAFSTNLNQYIAAGGMQPMTEMAKKWIAEQDSYIFTAESLTKEDGEIYSLPWETRLMLLYYRTDIFGEGPPFNSLQEVVTKGKQYSDGSNMAFCLGLHGDDGFLQQLQPVLFAFGARTYDENMNIAINSPETVKVIEWLRDLYQNGVMTDAGVAMNIEDTFNGMSAGTVYSIILGSHRYGALKNSEFGDRIATAAIPGEEPGTIAPAYNTSQTLGVGKQCQHPEIAFDFITANLTPEAGAEYFKASCMPVNLKVYEMDEVKSAEISKTMAEWKKIWDTGLDNFIFEPDINAEFSAALAEAVQKMVVHGADIKSGLDEVVARYQK